MCTGYKNEHLACRPLARKPASVGQTRSAGRLSQARGRCPRWQGNKGKSYVGDVACSGRLNTLCDDSHRQGVAAAVVEFGSLCIECGPSGKPVTFNNDLSVYTPRRPWRAVGAVRKSLSDKRKTNGTDTIYVSLKIGVTHTDNPETKPIRIKAGRSPSSHECTPRGQLATNSRIPGIHR